MNDVWDSPDIRVSEMNRECDLFVKTPVGETDISTLEKSITRECIRDNVRYFQV